MSKTSKHIHRSIDSSIEINGKPEIIWDNITNVKIEQFSDPYIFKLLDIPKPLRAEVLSEGEGGKRIAYFDTGKRFIQEIIVWQPLQEYSFLFNPERGFRVGYLFELSEGVFRILSGAYFLTYNGGKTSLQLKTDYSIDNRFYLLLSLPVKIILIAFQRYLLNSIKKNSE